MSVAREDLWRSLSLLVIGCAAYANAVAHPFVHDDIVFIAQNPAISRLDDIPGIFFNHSGAVIKGANAYYRPVLELIYRLEYRLFGLDPRGYHAFNILLHAVSGVLVFVCLSRLGLSRDLSWVVSVFFLVHPAQTEAVACVAGISNLASAFFVLACLGLYVSRRYIPAFAAFIAGLFTKESVVFLPLVLIWMDRWHTGETPRRACSRAGAFMAAAAAFLFLRQYLTGSNLISDICVSPGELRLRVLAIPRTLLTYLKIITWPNDLHYYRNTDILASNAWAFAVFGIIAPAGFLLFRRLNAGDRKTAVLGVGWSLLFLLPVLNVLPLINEYSFILTAEHFLYLPIIGILIIAALIASRLATGFAVRRMVFAVIFAACSVITVRQNIFWRGEIPLFERMVRFEPDFGRGHLLLANTYYADKRYASAREHYLKALSIMEGYKSKAQNTTAKDFYAGFIKDINAGLARLSGNQGQ